MMLIFCKEKMKMWLLKSLAGGSPTFVCELNPNITDIKIEERMPCDPSAITTWENQENVFLPEPLREFYCATDGFLMTWNYIIADESLPVGKLAIPRLEQLETWQHNSEDTNKDLQQKYYKLDAMKDEAAVYIILSPNVKCTNYGAIFYQSPSGNKKLVDSFIEYFTLLLVYRGLPEWQSYHLGFKTSYWSELLFVNFAPHTTKIIVAESSEERKELWQKKLSNRDLEYLYQEYPSGSVDANLFKTRKCKPKESNNP
ncbi:tubulin polyglutamylase complex subunit 2-like isoform X2 [Artemia franciscana]